MLDWQPMDTAPRDGTWILGINNRGNCAVIIWSDNASGEGRGAYAGWIHPFSNGELSTFWNGANGSLPIAWAAIPRGEDARAVVQKFGGKEMDEINRMRVVSGIDSVPGHQVGAAISIRP